MATKSKMAKWQKVKAAVNRNFKARKELSDKAKKGDWEAGIKLQKQPRDRSHVRLRARCNVCGRPHGTLKKFKLCRICLRNLLNRAFIPGAKKSSW